MLISKKYTYYTIAIGIWMAGFLFKIQTTFRELIPQELNYLRQMGFYFVILWIFLYGFRLVLKKAGLVSVLFFVIYLYISSHVGDTRYIEECVILVSAFFMPRKVMHDVLLGIISFLTFVPIIFAKVGIIDDINWMGRPWQECLGFTYYSFGSHMLFVTMLLYLMKKGEKINYKTWGILLIINQLVYTTTSLATTYYLTWILFILWLIAVRYSVLPADKIAIVAMPCVAVVSIFVALFYDKVPLAIRSLLGAELNNRMWLAHNGFQKNGFSLFGQTFETITQNVVRSGSSSWGDYNVIDNGYVYMLTTFGPIVLILVTILFVLWAQKAMHKKDMIVSICIIVISVDYFFTLFIMMVMHNPFLMLALSDLFQRDEQSVYWR